MNYENALIIFTKNLVYGQVKTRLAATIGNDKAFDIYKNLIAHTYSLIQSVRCDRIVYYSSYVESDDDNFYERKIQQGNDLGEKMKNAFKDVLQKKYSKAVIIGTDCAELNSAIVDNAFEQLNHHDIVIGPAADGGYYLLGMKKLHTRLFENMEWSTPAVFDKTISICNHHNYSYFILPTLHDVDVEDDLEYMSLHEMANRQLVFVYNADSGVFGSVTDFAHKILSPSTYSCRLCALTYGNFAIKDEWKNFIGHLPFSVIFLHKNDFNKTHKIAESLPAVFIKYNNSLQTFLSKAEIENCTTLQQLKEVILFKISKL